MVLCAKFQRLSVTLGAKVPRIDRKTSMPGQPIYLIRIAVYLRNDG